MAQPARMSDDEVLAGVHEGERHREGVQRRGRRGRRRRRPRRTAAASRGRRRGATASRHRVDEVAVRVDGADRRHAQVVPDRRHDPVHRSDPQALGGQPGRLGGIAPVADEGAQSSRRPSAPRSARSGGASCATAPRPRSRPRRSASGRRARRRSRTSAAGLRSRGAAAASASGRRRRRASGRRRSGRPRAPCAGITDTAPRSSS